MRRRRGGSRSRQTLKPNVDPEAAWDDALSWRMNTYGEARMIAVDKLLATNAGAATWRSACGAHAEKHARQHVGYGRRVPRNP